MIRGLTPLSGPVLIAGGAGFIGRHALSALASEECQLRIASRHPAKSPEPSGGAGRILRLPFDIRKPDSVKRALENCHSVVNLVGILNEHRRRDFYKIHVEATARFAQYAKEAGCVNFVHISAMGASEEAKSHYLRSKCLGAKAVLSAFPEAVILVPSLVFGAGDGFFCRFARMSSLSPFLPLIGGGRTLFQPCWAGDVAKAIRLCLMLPAMQGRILELGGPQCYSFRELLEFMLRETGRKRILLNIPKPIAFILGAVAQFLPTPPLTPDQVRILDFDCTIQGHNGFAELGIAPCSLELGMPPFLAPWRRGSDIQQ